MSTPEDEETNKKEGFGGMSSSQSKNQWGQFLWCVFKRFVATLIFGIIGASIIYLSKLDTGTLDKLFPTNRKDFPKGPFGLGEPDMRQWPYTYLDPELYPDTGIFSQFRKSIVFSIRETYTLVRIAQKYLIQMVGGFSSSEGFFGCELRWLTYFLWNFTYQIIGMLMPFISTFIFCFCALFNTLGTLSGALPSKLDPNNWTIADWTYFFGAKSGIEKSKWLYFGFALILFIFTIVFLLAIYLIVVLPGCWFTCACVAIGITLRYYFSFFLVPLARSGADLKDILACDYKLLMFVFGAMCIMDAMKYLDKITYNTMIVFFIGLILHAIAQGLQD